MICCKTGYGSAGIRMLVLLYGLPYDAHWSYYNSNCVRCAQAFSLCPVFTPLDRRIKYTEYPEIWRAIFQNRTQALSLGTLPTGFATTVDTSVLVCVPTWVHLGFVGSHSGVDDIVNGRSLLREKLFWSTFLDVNMFPCCIPLTARTNDVSCMLGCFWSRHDNYCSALGTNCKRLACLFATYLPIYELPQIRPRYCGCCIRCACRYGHSDAAVHLVTFYSKLHFGGHRCSAFHTSPGTLFRSFDHLQLTSPSYYRVCHSSPEASRPGWPWHHMSRRSQSPKLPCSPSILILYPLTGEILYMGGVLSLHYCGNSDLPGCSSLLHPLRAPSSLSTWVDGHSHYH